jgi:hypothetical protein
MNLRPTLCILAIAGLAAGCASADFADDAPAKPEKVYRTGSNIPVRPDSMPDSVGTASVQSGDAASLGRTSVPIPRPGGR